MIAVYWRAARGRFLLITLTTLALAVAIVHQTLSLRAVPALLAAMAGALLVHAGSNLWNDYADELNGTDRANRRPTPFNGGSRVIQRGELSAAKVRTAAILAYLLVLLLSLLLVARSGWAVLFLTLAGIALAISYSSPPFHLSGRAMGPWVVTLCFGPLLAQGAVLVLSGRLSLTALWASLPMGLLVGAILALNELPDIAPDSLAGKRTLPVRRGPRAAILVHRICILGAFAFLTAAALFRLIPAWWSLLAAPAAIRIVIRAGRLVRDPGDDFCRIAASTIALHTGVGVLLALGFLL